MQMQTVPTSLIGASLGEAHKWVREQMVFSNPGKPMADYTLKNQDGKAISLSDLTKGRASHVTIVGAGSTVRKNPASPGELAGFMEVPPPMHRTRLTALTQDDITPALYNAMVNEYGLFGATQTLSILLTRPVSPSLHHTQKTTNLIRARRGESLLPLHRFLPPRQEKKKQQNQENRNRNRNSRNRGGGGGSRPNPTPAEATNAAVALGLGANVSQAAARMGRAGGLNLSLDKTTQDIRREVDRMLDNAEDAFQQDEAGALVSVANRMSIKYENSEQLFRNFAQNVLSPYLITSTANTNALKYINEYILPAMREIVGNSDRRRRRLDSQYRYLVNKLATDPRDFYMGTELALIAHPGFLFPRAGLALMPVPQNTRDMAFRAFQQAGTPPTYDPNTGFIATIAPSDRSGVAYINQNTFQQINSQTFAQGRNINRVSQVIDSLINVIERYGETDSSAFNVLKRDTQSMAALAARDQLYQRIAGMPVFYFTDLPGIRPIPTNWPQQLILAMMEVLAQNRDRITGLGGGPFNANDFLTPSGINLSSGSAFGDFANYMAWRAEVTALYTEPAGSFTPLNAAFNEEIHARAERVLTSLATMAEANGTPMFVAGAGGNNISPLLPAGPATDNLVVTPDQPAMEASSGTVEGTMLRWNNPGNPPASRPIGPYPNFASFLRNAISQDRDALGPTGAGGFSTVGYALPIEELIRTGQFVTFADYASQNMVQIEPITAQAGSASPSVYEIMVDTVELSMRKYNYNPTKDDIYFSTILLYYSLREMGLDTEVRGLMDRISDRIADARNASLNRLRNDLAARYGAPAPGGGAINMQDLNNYMALRYAYEAFNDPTSDAFLTLTGVRVNPAPVVTDSSIKNIRESLKQSINEFEEALKRSGKKTNAEQVAKALEKLLLPSMIAQMNSDPKSLITYAGKLAEPSAKLIEAVNDLFGECEVAVKEHINALSMLARDMTAAPTRGATPADDVIESLTMLKGTTSKLSLLDRTATAMDDMVKFLPDSTTRAEKAYINSMKDFMTIIGDNIQFNNETIEDLVKGINNNKTDYAVGPAATAIRPYPILSTLLDELNEMRQVVAALDTSVDVFNDYSTRDAEAVVKYSNFASSSTTGLGDTLSNTKRMLVDAYSVTLEAMTFHGLSRADVEATLDTFVGGKADIPIKDQRTGVMLPNPFDSFVRGANSNVLVQALHKSTDLEIVGLSPGAKLREFQALFEVAPRYGEVLLNFFSEIYDDIGFANGPIFEAKLDRLIKAKVDALYKKYQRRSKLGQAQRLLKADTFALLEATGRGIKATFTGLGTAAGGTVGAFGGAAVGGATQAFPVARDLTIAGTQAATGAALAAGGVIETAGGAIYGTGQMLQGAMIGAGKAAAGVLAGLGGAVLAVGSSLGNFGVGVAGTAFLLHKKWWLLYANFWKSVTLTGLSIFGGLLTNLAVGSFIIVENKVKIKKKIAEDPDFIRNEIDLALAKQNELLEKAQIAADERERRALELAAGLSFLGAKRATFLAKQVEAEARQEEAEARRAAAEVERVEKETLAIVAAAELEGLIRAEEAEERAFQREQGRLDREEERVIAEQERQAALSLRADTVADLQIDLKALNRKKISFENDHFGKDLRQPLTPEMRRKYGGTTRQSAANRLVELENEIAAKRQEIKRLQGGR